jgi:hypothetical protein
VTYFLFLEFALLGTVALFWHYVTGFLASSFLEQAGVDASQETLLYVVWAIIVSFIVAWFIPLRESYDRDAVFKGAVVNTVGWWFFAALLSGGLVLFALVKGSTPGQGGLSTAGSAKDASYDQVG